MNSMNSEIHLSVVVPSYNEQKNMKRGALDGLLNYLLAQQYSWELILSDDGSTDGTQDSLEKFAEQHPCIKVIQNTHKGKGPAVKAGMLAGKGNWLLFTDFDQSTPISEIEKLWPFTLKDYEVIIGSREVKGAIRETEPFYRHIMGRGFNAVVQMLTIPGIQDTQCGFKLFSSRATRNLFTHLYVYGGNENLRDAFTGAFDVELLFLAQKYDFRIAEVPIFWKHFETERVNPAKDSFRMFRDVMRIRWANLTGKYPKNI
jgi:dolichyl-phosphate beta-glucosyltransferase